MHLILRSIRWKIIHIFFYRIAMRKHATCYIFLHACMCIHGHFVLLLFSFIRTFEYKSIYTSFTKYVCVRKKTKARLLLALLKARSPATIIDSLGWKSIDCQKVVFSYWQSISLTVQFFSYWQSKCIIGIFAQFLRYMDLGEPTAGIAYIYNCRRQHSSLKQNMNESPKQLRKSRDRPYPSPSELGKCDLQGSILPPPLDLRQFLRSG